MALTSMILKKIHLLPGLGLYLHSQNHLSAQTFFSQWHALARRSSGRMGRLLLVPSTVTMFIKALETDHALSSKCGTWGPLVDSFVRD
jgi:hypothetical protein